MKYFAVLSLVASLVAADGHLSVPAAEHASSTTYAIAAESAAHTGGVKTHTVTVGGVTPAATGGVSPVLLYNPESIEAAQGDVVKFLFKQKNHTVTQSTFEDPCKAMPGGENSGFIPNPMGMEGPEFEWEMTVPTTDPLWFYCAQRNGTHCGKGMVFSINAAKTGDKTFDAFKILAIQKNGTEALSTAAIQSVDPTAAAAPSAVTIIAGGEVVHPSATGAAATATASVVAGEGQTGNGDACTCHCLCGVSDFPQALGVGSFGGQAGIFPS